MSVWKVYIASSWRFFQSFVRAGAAALIGDTLGEARDTAEDAEREDSSEGVGARSVVFFEARVASEMLVEKGGLRMPTLGVIMNF